LLSATPEIDIVHVNCGFLPTSEPVWRDAWAMVTRTGAAGRDGSGSGWLHLHENVAADRIEARREEIGRLFQRWAAEDDDCNLERGGDGQQRRQQQQQQKRTRRRATVEHVELVKTFAPGVWHVVFDVYCETVSEEEDEGR